MNTFNTPKTEILVFMKPSIFTIQAAESKKKDN